MQCCPGALSCCRAAVFAVGVAAGEKHTLMAGADGAVWGFGRLNALRAWNDLLVKTMRETEDGVTEYDAIFGDSKYEIGTDAAPALRDIYNFLFPHGRESIAMSVRIPIDVRSPMLQGGASFARAM
jgi:hypothetical protein